MRKDEMCLTRVPTSHSRQGHADLQRGKAALMAMQQAPAHAKAEQGKCVASCADCRLQAQAVHVGL
jgi:hypothetical protein